MSPVIDPEFKSLIQPLAADELSQLEANIKAEGCRDALVVWRGILLDGHNRFDICQRAGLPFRTVDVVLPNREAAINWIIDNQLGRRNLTPEQMSYLRGKRYNQEKKEAGDNQFTLRSDHFDQTIPTAERLASQYKVSAPTIRRDAQFAQAVDTIAESTGPDARQQILGREATLPKNAVIAIASAPAEEQRRVISLDDHKAIIEAAKQIQAAKREVKQAQMLEQRRETAASVAQIQNPNFINGDCLNLLPLLAPKTVRLLMTDPPYGMDFQSNRREVTPQAAKIANDGDLDAALFLLDNMLLAVDHAMMDDCHLLIFTGWRHEPEFRKLIESHRYTVKASIVWVKENHTSGDLNGFAPRHERIIHAVRGKALVTPRIDDVLIVDRERSTTHPTEKPTALLRKLINSTTIERELVVDPFAGTGATLLAAAQLARIYWGCELSTNWHAEGVVRIANANVRNY